MNPKARITYRFETVKTPGSRGVRSIVRIGPGGRDEAADAQLREDSAGAQLDRRSGAGDWPYEELQFTADAAPWKSPFQDDPDALERLIRATDGQLQEPEPASDSGREQSGIAGELGEIDGRNGIGLERRGRGQDGSDPAPGGQDESVIGRERNGELKAESFELQHAGGWDTPDADPADAGSRTDDADAGPDLWNRGVRPIIRTDEHSEPLPAADGYPGSGGTGAFSGTAANRHAGWRVQRRRPPVPSWPRVALSVAAAVMTGAMFGYLVLSLFSWQPDKPAGSDGLPLPRNEADASGVMDNAAANADLPAAGSLPPLPEQTGLIPVDLPAAQYYLLQYGVFSTGDGLAEALAQLQGGGYAASADEADGYRAYAGIADSREAAEALAARYEELELYIKPLDIPAADRLVYAGEPETAESFFEQTRELMRMMNGMSAGLLAEGGGGALSPADWTRWRNAHRSWTEAAAAFRAGAPEGSGYDALVRHLGIAAAAFEAYGNRPEPEHMLAAQSALMDAAIVLRNWMRSPDSL